MTIGTRIQEYRKRCALSQEQLAERLGVSRQAVSKWELDAAVPDTDKVVALAEVFGVSTDALLRGEREEERPAEQIAPPRRGDGLGWLLQLVRTKGYRAGYLLMAWGAGILLLAGAGAFMFYQMLRPALGMSAGFGLGMGLGASGFGAAGGMLKVVFIVPAIGAAIGAAMIIAGVVVVVKYKNKKK